VHEVSELRILMVTMDYTTSEVVLTRSDRKEARLPLPGAPVDTGALARVQYAPGLNGLLAVTKAGDEVSLFHPA
jgi:hypothetical protein